MEFRNRRIRGTLLTFAVSLTLWVGADPIPQDPIPPEDCADCIAFSNCEGYYHMVDPACDDNFDTFAATCPTKTCAVDYPSCKPSVYYWCQERRKTEYVSDTYSFTHLILPIGSTPPYRCHTATKTSSNFGVVMGCP